MVSINFSIHICTYLRLVNQITLPFFLFGEAIFITIALSMEFISVVPWHTLLKLIIVSFMIKLVINPIFAIPSSIIAAILKRIEQIDIYDHDIEFNPFKIKAATPTNDTAF